MQCFKNQRIKLSFFFSVLLKVTKTYKNNFFAHKSWWNIYLSSWKMFPRQSTVQMPWAAYQVISLLTNIYSWKHLMNFTLFQVMLCVKLLVLESLEMYLIIGNFAFTFRRSCIHFSTFSKHLVFISSMYFLNPGCSKWPYMF